MSRLPEPSLVHGATLLARRRQSVLLVREEDDGQKVVLKVLDHDEPDAELVSRFRNDVELTRDLDVPGVRRGLGYERLGGKLALRLEHVPGAALEPRRIESPKELRAFLRLALELARVLAGIHARGVVHRDVKPQNIVRDPASGRLWLIDFGLASPLAQTEPPDALEGTLDYVSPEQTGRTARPVDARSDLYSFGATLYALAAGEPPFAASDPMAVLHGHLAKPPPALSERVRAIPEALSRIIAKLLAKEPDDRYRSARGLAADLERCLRELDEGGVITPFELATRDAPLGLSLPAKLYGRERELAALEAVAQEAAGGRAAVVLVEGPSGSGKSSLALALRPTVLARGGYFVQGKLDQRRQHAPYHGLQHAFGALIEQLLVDDEQALAQLQAALRSSLEGLGRALEVIAPGIERLIGESPELAQLGSAERRHRLELAVRRFVRAVCGTGRCLVLLVDDLQWADAASLGLLEALATDDGLSGFLLIASHRPEDVSAAHPLTAWRHRLEASGRVALLVEPGSLGKADAEALLRDLGVLEEDARELARLVLARTGGNPFFVRQFLLTAIEEGHLVRAPDGQARVDLAGLAGARATENVASLLTARFAQLPEGTRETLGRAACAGDRFTLGVLSRALDSTPLEVARALWPAVEHGLLEPRGAAARLFRVAPSDDAALSPAYAELTLAFVHDRVQQAAYQSAGGDVRQATHAALGWTLAAQEADLFDAAGQLEAGSGALDSSERSRAAELAVRAAEAALEAAAFDQASRHAAFARSLLEPRDHYSLLCRAWSVGARAAWCAGAHDEVDRVASEALPHARDVLDVFGVHEARLMSAISRDELSEALAIGRALASALGVRFPRRPALPHIILSMGRTRLSLLGREVEALGALPPMRDPRVLAAMETLDRMIPAAFRSSDKLFPLLVFRLVQLSVQHGNSPVSAFGYAGFGISLCGVVGDVELGYRFGKVAIELVDALGAEAMRSKVLFVFSNFIRHWKEPLRESLVSLSEASEAGQRTGNVFEAVWSAVYRVLWSLWTGERLSEVGSALEAQRGLFAQDEGAVATSGLIAQVIADLRADAPPERALHGACFDAEAAERRYASATDRTEVAIYHLHAAWLELLFGRSERALEHVRACEQPREREAVTAMPFVPLRTFVGALARAMAAPAARAERQQVEKALTALEGWAARVPSDHAHRALLVRAELLRARGEDPRAAYEAAIEAAHASGSPMEEAFVLERAGEEWLRRGQSLFAEALLRRAMASWAALGASAKVADLGARHPVLLRDHAAPESSSRRSSSRSDSSAGLAIDLGSFVKAATSISGELTLEGVSTRLLSIVLETAGARRAAIVLAGDRKRAEAALRLEAEADLTGVRVRLDAPLESAAGALDPAVRYAVRLRAPVVVHDALEDPRFARHPKVKAERPRSVLAVPLLRSGELLGALYLENDLIAGAFTPSRVELLGLLAGQVAISLDNARLYERLEGALSEQVALTAAQARFVPREFLHNLGRDTIAEVALGDSVQKDMSILFSDIRGFTPLVEGLSADRNIAFINEYLRAMEPPVLRHGGFIDSYIGDAIMALFETGAEGAVGAAVDMMRSLATLNDARRARGEPPVRVGIGINAGPLTLGTIGGAARIKCGVIGESVNLASRVESATKRYGVPILVSDRVAARLPEGAHSLREVDRVQLFGTGQPTTLYEVFDADPRAAEKRAHAALWERALAAYAGRAFGEAAASFRRYAEAVDDPVARIRSARAEALAMDPPGDDWTPVEIQRVK